MKKRPEFFVVGDKVHTKEDGKEVRLKKLRRFTSDGFEVTPLIPYVLGKHVVLMGSNRPVTVSYIYKNGDVKELSVPEEYKYEIVTTPLPVPKKKRPAL